MPAQKVGLTPTSADAMTAAGASRVEQRTNRLKATLGSSGGPYGQVLTAVAKNMGAGPIRSALPRLKEECGLDAPFNETEHGDTLLTLAARNENSEAIRFLLSEGARPDAPAKDGATPLFLSVEHANAKLAKCLIEAKADATRACGDGRTPLLVASCKKSGEDCVKLLLGALPKGATEVAAQGGITALLKAAFLGHDVTVRELLKAGAKASHADEDGATALHLACRNGHAKTAQQLIKAGSPLAACTKGGGATPLHLAARFGHHECVSLLLAAKADANAVAANDVTPLHLAVQSNQPRCVRMLLEAKANIDAVDRDGVPPLYLAHELKHKECSKLLVAFGAEAPRGNGAPTGGSSSPFW